MSNDPFDTVRSGYDRIAADYLAWSQHSRVRLQQVARLLDELQPMSTVVELGCGAGEPATRLLAERHRVIAIDASRVQLHLARAAAPDAMLLQGDIMRWHLQPDRVDAVASFYALGHLPSHAHTGLFERIATWLRPGGRLLTSAPLTPGDETAADWLGVPMFFGGIGERATREAVRAAGLVIDQWDVIEEDEGDGSMVSFGWLLAHRPSRGR